MKRTHTLDSAVAECTRPGASYTDRLEECLVTLCRELGTPVPLWLKKNTREFARFRRTFFFNGQFDENVRFDRFEIREIGD